MVLSREQRDHSFAVDEAEERNFRTVEEGLEENRVSGLEQFCGMIARGETIRRDDYALTRGQSVVLDHPVGTEAVECFVELGRLSTISL